MKNNKGFTLVELLAAITILGIITTLSLPLIRTVQNNNVDRQYKAYRDSLLSSAKLYNDTYEEDLFGHQKNGCAVIYYDNLKRADLIKDIQKDDVTCYSDKTYIKVVKYNNQYYYYPSLGCGNKKTAKLLDDEINYTLGDEDKINIDDCINEGGTGGGGIISISATGDSTGNYDRKIKTSKVTISSSIGVNQNARIFTAWSQADSPSNVTNWEALNITIPSIASQASEIEKGNSIIITSQELRTPSGGNGDYYLIVRVDRLEDSNGDRWKNPTNPDNPDSPYLVYGPFKVDNTPPMFNDSTLISNITGYNGAKPTLKLNVTDNYSTTTNLRMCYSLDSDTCEKTSEAFIDETKYKKYQATTKNLVFPGGTTLNGSNHKVYVTVIDEAKNYNSIAFDYQFAYSYKLTYNTTGGTSCSPSSKTITYNPGETKKWGELCTTTKKGYSFKEWNTSQLGNGTTITADSVVDKSLTVAAVWTPHICHIVFDPNGGTFTTNATNTTEDCQYNGTNKCNSNMKDANGGTFSATKSGQTIVSGQEWIKSDGTTYDQSKGYTAKEFCPNIENSDETVTLKVNWQEEQYKISYDYGIGQLPSGKTNPTSYAVSSETITLNNPSASGNTFIGWSGTGLTGNNNMNVTIPKGSSGNREYKANYETNQVLIKYNMNGGHLIDSTNRSQYASDVTGEVIFNGSPIITRANYQENLPSGGLADYNSSVWMNIEKEGQTAVKGAEWKCLEGCATPDKTYNQETVYQASDFCDAKNGSCTVTLQVNWEEAAYKIILNNQEATTPGTEEIYEKYNYGWYADKSATNLISNIELPSKEGYVFGGYYTKVNGEGTEVIDENGVIIAGLTTLFKSDGEIFAKWLTDNYSISYNLNNGTYGTNHPTKASFGETIKIDNPTKNIKVILNNTTEATIDYTLSNVSASGDLVPYTFTGWNITGMDNSTHTYGTNTTTENSIDSTKEINYKNLRASSGIVTFKALWNNPEIILPTINIEGGSCKWKKGSKYIDSGGIYSNVNGETEITFSTQCDMNIIPISLNNMEATSSGSKTIYEKYSVGWYTNMLATTKLTTIIAPTKTGYTFGGYYTNPNGEGEQIINESGSVIASNKKFLEATTIYAYWKEIPSQKYNINYELNDGTLAENSPRLATFNTIITIPKPSKEGAAFLGWTVTEGLSIDNAKFGYDYSSVTYFVGSEYTKLNAMYFINLTDGDTVTLTANWSENVTCSISATGGTSEEVDGITWYKSGTQTITLNTTPSNATYTFCGPKNTDCKSNSKTKTLSADLDGGVYTATVTYEGLTVTCTRVVYRDTTGPKVSMVLKDRTTTDEATCTAIHNNDSKYQCLNNNTEWYKTFGNDSVSNGNLNATSTPDYNKALWSASTVDVINPQETLKVAATEEGSGFGSGIDSFQWDYGKGYNDFSSNVTIQQYNYVDNKDTSLKINAYKKFDTPGEKSLKYKAVDKLGNISEYTYKVTLTGSTVKPAKPTIDNPTKGNWTKTNFSITVSTTTPAKEIGYWYLSYDNKNFVRYDSSSYNSYGKNTFTTSPFSAERNQLAYIRVCNISASGPTDTANCSDSASTYIRIDKTPPQNYPTNYKDCDSIISGYIHCLAPTAVDYGSGIKEAWITTSGDYNNYHHTAGPVTIWQEQLNTTTNKVCFYWNKICDAVDNCVENIPSPQYCKEW